MIINAFKGTMDKLGFLTESVNEWIANHEADDFLVIDQEIYIDKDITTMVVVVWMEKDKPDWEKEHEHEF